MWVLETASATLPADIHKVAAFSADGGRGQDVPLPSQDPLQDQGGCGKPREFYVSLHDFQTFYGRQVSLVIAN